MIEAFRNDGYTEKFLFFSPSPGGRGCPGSLPNQRFGRVGKGGGIFAELHPHPDPLPSREREKKESPGRGKEYREGFLLSRVRRKERRFVIPKFSGESICFCHA